MASPSPISRSLTNPGSRTLNGRCGAFSLLLFPLNGCCLLAPQHRVCPPCVEQGRRDRPPAPSGVKRGPLDLRRRGFRKLRPEKGERSRDEGGGDTGPASRHTLG